MPRHAPFNQRLPKLRQRVERGDKRQAKLRERVESIDRAKQWKARLRERMRREKERKAATAGEVPQPLPKLPPGPWISRGRVLDYERWPERERFKELDKALSLGARDYRILAMYRTGLFSHDIGAREDMTAAAVRQVICKWGRRRRAALDEAP